MKNKSSVRKRCSDCYFALRDKVLFVYCEKRRHNQRQGKGGVSYSQGKR